MSHLSRAHPGERASNCRYCHAPVVWRTSPAGRRVPVDISGGDHRRECPHQPRREYPNWVDHKALAAGKD